MTGRRTGVIGAGILGLAIASRLAEVDPSSEITVLDKEVAVGRHQTGHNSGVAHAGVYYPPGSLKATLCRRGIALLKDYCVQHGIAYDECGKLIIARDASELARLDEIERRATANGVPGLRRLGAGADRDGGAACPRRFGAAFAVDGDRGLPGRGGVARHRDRCRRRQRSASASKSPRSSGAAARPGPREHRRGVGLRSFDRLRRAAVRSAGGDGRRERDAGDHPVPRRVLPARARAARSWSPG